MATKPTTKSKTARRRRPSASKFAETLRHLIDAGPAADKDVVSLGSNGQYDVYMLQDPSGRAVIVAGCRQFTLPAAYAHWYQARRMAPSVSRMVAMDDYSRLYWAEYGRRASRMVVEILPKAERIAERRGWIVD